MAQFWGPVEPGLEVPAAEAAGGALGGVVDLPAPSIAGDLPAIQGPAEFSLVIESTPVPRPTEVVERDEWYPPEGELGPAPPSGELVPPGGDVWAGLGLPVDGIQSGSRQAVTVKVTHYWPPAGGTNCYHFAGGVCVSAMFSGAPWEPFVGIAAACPWEWKVGNAVAIGGRLFICLDRGAMTCEDGICHVDILTDRAVDGIYSAERWY